MKIKSSHKKINGNVNGNSFEVAFDANGEADVDEAVGEFLLRLHSATLIPEKEEEPKTDDGADLYKEEPTAQKQLTEMTMKELQAEAERLEIDVAGLRTKPEVLVKIQSSAEEKGSESGGE